MYQSWSFEPVKKGVFCGSMPRNFSIAINYLVYTAKSKVIGLNWLLGTHLLHCTDKYDLLCIFTQFYSFEKLNPFDLIVPQFFLVNPFKTMFRCYTVQYTITTHYIHLDDKS